MLYLADSVAKGETELSKDMGGIATHNSLDVDSESSKVVVNKETKTEKVHEIVYAYNKISFFFFFRTVFFIYFSFAYLRR